MNPAKKPCLTRGWDLIAYRSMKMNLFWLGLICAGGVLLAGCVNTLDGRQQAGIPLVKDTVSRRYERTPLDIWAVAKVVLSRNGTLFSEDHLQSTLQASVDRKTVWVKVEPVDQRVTKVSVQVRTKSGAGDLDLAGEMQTEIALGLAAGGSPAAAVKPGPGAK